VNEPFWNKCQIDLYSRHRSLCSFFGLRQTAARKILGPPASPESSADIPVIADLESVFSVLMFVQNVD